MLLPWLWAACALAGYLYALQQHIPMRIALEVLPAFLLEAAFFYALAVERVRLKVDGLGSRTVAFALVLAAVAPYTVGAIGAGAFRWQSLLWIAVLSAAASFWYVLLPRTPAADVLFLVLMAVVMVTRIFHQLYLTPYPRLQFETLGHAMWVRTGAFAMLSVRRVSGVGFGFWPEKREWKIGALYYLLFLPVAAGVAWWIGFGQPVLSKTGWEKTSLLAVATFFGVLWVLALGEEFFFRGLLQQWMTGWLKNATAGLLVTSILFGSVHLWFRKFPNWRFAVMAAIAGLFYGLAFQKARSIRASMVTHALVVTTWRIFFP
jgi:membrane protease YdiL (CAAX protease family)